jgi:hypothetical protein
MIARPRTRRAPTLLLLALAAAAGCATDPVGPAFPRDAMPIGARPVQYATWWRMTEACSGLRGDLDAVRWYAVPSGPFAVGGGAGAEARYDGYWFGDGNRIVLAAGWTGVGATVRHEMLHALLQSGAHPAAYFRERCGPVVACVLECAVREADRGVPADAREVPAESLAIALALAPAGAPAVSIDSGWTTIVVTATNVRAEPVWVPVAENMTFGYVFAGQYGTFHWSDEPRWAFRAGESRALAFDRQLGPAGSRDTLWGFFGRAHTAARPIAIAP